MTLLMVLAFGAFTNPSLVPGAKLSGAKASSGLPGMTLRLRIFQIVTGTADRAELSEQADLRVSNSPILSD